MNKPVSIGEFKEALSEEIEFYKNSNNPIPELNDTSLSKIEAYLAMPFQTGFGTELYPSVYDKAAILMYLICKGHSLSNGNKRMSLVTMLLFLQKNNVAIPYFDAYNLAVTVAKSESSQKDEMLILIKNTIMAVVNYNSKKKPEPPALITPKKTELWYDADELIAEQKAKIEKAKQNKNRK